jgi:hypothetical protein
MRAVLAVATLDLRRLWMVVGSAGVALGLFPSLTRGLSLHATAQDTFPFAIAAAAVIAGAAFGWDFGENKPSFFYARPLSTVALFAGRLAALLGLVLLSIAAFQLVQGLSRLLWPVSPMASVRPAHLIVIAACWPVALFFALAAAVHTRTRAKVGLRAFILGALRLTGVIALTAVMVAIFADLTMRAYENRTPIDILMSSYVIAAFIVSYVAIELGRSNRLRITEVLNLGAYVHTSLACVVVLIAWFYVLRPGPDAIISVTGAVSSPDGGAAYVAARVDRGSDTYHPRFRVDLSTGDVRRLDRGALNAAREMPGQWHSSDGGTQAWLDQTPMLLRSGRQLFLPRLSPFHFQAPFNAEQSLALPHDFVVDLDWEIRGQLVDILPSSGGGVFAFYWFDRAGQHLAFTSPTRGQLSVVDLTAMRSTKRAWMFLPSGQLRVAFQRRVDKTMELQFLDIDPASAKVTTVASAPLGPLGEMATSVRFDEAASRALVVGGPAHEKRAMLLTLDASPQPVVHMLAAVKQVHLESGLLADGRVVAIVRQPPHSELRVFSKAGEPLLTIPLGEGYSRIGNEPFPNVLIVSTQTAFKSIVLLFDTTTGRLLRQLDGFYAPAPFLSFQSEPAPAGSPGARILMAKETLYLLPSVTESPRQLLPRP